MTGTNKFKEPNITVSASIGVELYNRARQLQKAGHESANWSNAMRRGLSLIIDCAEGNDPYHKVEKLIKRLEQETQEKNTYKDILKTLNITDPLITKEEIILKQALNVQD